MTFSLHTFRMILRFFFVSESGSQKSQKLKIKILINEKKKLENCFCIGFRTLRIFLNQKLYRAIFFWVREKRGSACRSLWNPLKNLYLCNYVSKFLNILKICISWLFSAPLFGGSWSPPASGGSAWEALPTEAVVTAGRIAICGGGGSSRAGGSSWRAAGEEEQIFTIGIFF